MELRELDMMRLPSGVMALTVSEMRSSRQTLRNLCLPSDHFFCAVQILQPLGFGQGAQEVRKQVVARLSAACVSVKLSNCVTRERFAGGPGRLRPARISSQRHRFRRAAQASTTAAVPRRTKGGCTGSAADSWPHRHQHRAVQRARGFAFAAPQRSLAVALLRHERLTLRGPIAGQRWS